MYLSILNTREYTGSSGIDFFDTDAFAGDLEMASRVSFQRPIWATFNTDAADDDGPGIIPPSPVLGQSWAHIKAARRNP